MSEWEIHREAMRETVSNVKLAAEALYPVFKRTLAFITIVAAVIAAVVACALWFGIWGVFAGLVGSGLVCLLIDNYLYNLGNARRRKHQRSPHVET